MNKKANKIVTAEIIKARENGTLGEVLPSGTSVKTTLGNKEAVFDVARDSRKTYLVMHNVMRRTEQMNWKQTNDGGWYASDLRAYVSKLFKELPAEVRELAIPVRNRQVCRDKICHGDDWLGVVESDDLAFILSPSQVFGGNRPEDCGDEQLDIFTDPVNRIKYMEFMDGGEPVAWWWWLRSAINTAESYSCVASYDFGLVDADGVSGYTYSNSFGGVVIAICIEDRS